MNGILLICILCVSLACSSNGWAQATIWESYNAKGQKAQADGDYQTSERFFVLAREEALRLAEAGDARAPELLCKALDGLSTSYSRQGKHTLAEKASREALSLADAGLYNESDESYSILLNNLGLILSEAKKFKEAEEIHRRAMRLRERFDSPPYRNLTLSILNLGKDFFDEGRYDEAGALFDRAFELFSKSSPDDVIKGDFWIMQAIMHNQILVAEKQKHLSQALKESEALISLIEVVSGKNSPALIGDLEVYERLLRSSKRFALAAKVNARLMAIQRNK